MCSINPYSSLIKQLKKLGHFGPNGGFEGGLAIGCPFRRMRRGTGYAGLLDFRKLRRVDRADVQQCGWDFASVPVFGKILGRHLRRHFDYRLLAKDRFECFRQTRGERGIVIDNRMDSFLLGNNDFRLTRSTRGDRLTQGDSADCGQRLPPDFQRVGPHRKLQPHFIRNDIALRAAMNGSYGYHYRIYRIVLARDDGLDA